MPTLRQVVPVFPPYDLPVWTSLATGLYPRATGVVGDHMFNLKSRELFSTEDPEASLENWWTGGEPIWSLAAKHGRRVNNSAPKSSIRRFVITEKAPTRAFSWLKAATSAFTFKTLLRHYAKQALTPRSLNVKLAPRRKSQGTGGYIRHYVNQTARPL